MRNVERQLGRTRRIEREVMVVCPKASREVEGVLINDKSESINWLATLVVVYGRLLIW